MENKIYFRSKRDVNGNWYYLTVDLENKTINRDYNIGKTKSDVIELNSKKELNKATDFFKNAGFNHKIIIGG